MIDATTLLVCDMPVPPWSQLFSRETTCPCCSFALTTCHKARERPIDWGVCIFCGTVLRFTRLEQARWPDPLEEIPDWIDKARTEFRAHMLAHGKRWARGRKVRK